MTETSSTLEVRRQHQSPLLSDILATLSFALDLTEGAVAGHAVRSALLGLRIGTALGLNSQELEHLRHASLLKDVGCSSNAARMCQIVGGDDRAVKAGVKLEDWTRPYQPRLSTLKLLWGQVLPGQSAYRKAMRIAQIGATQHSNNREMIELRCDRGASIVRKIGLGPEVESAVRHLDEHWDGAGYPSRLRGREIPLLARMMSITQHLDAFCMQVGPQRAIDVMLERSHRWFDPELVRTVRSLHTAGRLWQQCMPEHGHADAHRAVLEFCSSGEERLVPSSIDEICEAFAEVVDAKSPFTYRHSVGVKDAALRIGRAMGLEPAQLVLLRRAALLHDIGKLSVSNLILDKPDKLEDSEFQIIKQHPGHTREILDRMPAFHEMAVIAGEHHEKLDGTGYPDRLHASQLSLDSRLIAVADVYGALCEDRPYRPGLEPDEIARILKSMTPGKLDPDCVEAVLSGDARPAPPPAPLLFIPPIEAGNRPAHRL